MFRPVCGAVAALIVGTGVAGNAFAQPSGDEAAIRALEARFARR